MLKTSFSHFVGAIVVVSAFFVVAYSVHIHDGMRRHVRFHVDLGAAATIGSVLASGGHFCNNRRSHVHHHLVLGTAANMWIMTSGDLFHKATMNLVRPVVALGAAATRYTMASGDHFHSMTTPRFLLPSISALLYPITSNDKNHNL